MIMITFHENDNFLKKIDFQSNETDHKVNNKMI